MRLLAVAVLCLAAAGCRRAGSGDSTDRHVADLLRRHGVAASEVSCFSESEGEAACELRLPREQVDTVVTNLHLTPVLKPTVFYSEEKCRAIPSFSDRYRVALYESGRRTPELKLSSSAFEYLVLYQDLAGDEVCLQLAYSER